MARDLRSRTYGVYEELDAVSRHIDRTHDRLWRLKATAYMSDADADYYDKKVEQAEDELLKAKKLVARATDLLGHATAAVDPYEPE